MASAVDDFKNEQARFQELLSQLRNDLNLATNRGITLLEDSSDP